jgi:Fic family protein
MPRITGTFEQQTVGAEQFAAFIPAALPPRDPPLTLDDLGRELLERAQRCLEHLDLAAGWVPSTEGFVHALARKEAVASCQIAGTKATLTDLLGDETGSNVAEIRNYLGAVAHCRKEMKRREGDQPSMRLLNEAHRRLMRGVSGHVKHSGRLRTTQAWVGGTRPGDALHVPPPTYEVARTLGDLQTYIHKTDGLPPLVRVALVHAQFASIRPYLDGNGRIGRLLVTLLLERWRLLRAPVLYLSVFLQRERAEYLRLLTAIRHDGDWESWVRFFLDGVATIAAEALVTARSLGDQMHRDRDRVLSSPHATLAGLRLLDQLPRHPLVSIPQIVALLETTPPTAAKAVALLESLGILEEISGRQRYRTWSYAAYLALLRGGMD